MISTKVGTMLNNRSYRSPGTLNMQHEIQGIVMSYLEHVVESSATIEDSHNLSRLPPRVESEGEVE